MQTKNSLPLPPPPRGWRAIPWRLPVWLYRLGLGWLLGRRFLLLVHIGRKTGRRRQNVLEVVRYDPTGPMYYVVSGFGRRAQWFRNILVHPEVEIHVGRQRMRAVAEVLEPATAFEILWDYAQRHPRALRGITRLLRLDIPINQDGVRRLAQVLPVVAFRVHSEVQDATKEDPS